MERGALNNAGFQPANRTPAGCRRCFETSDRPKKRIEEAERVGFDLNLIG
jgi:hypothetical protein